MHIRKVIFMKKQLVITEDGSHTLFIPELNEHYHSTYGAINESMHVYIENGLLQCSKKKLTIFEIGFGTGLNAYLSYCLAQIRGYEIHYFSIEKYPLNSREYRSLNYASQVYPQFQEVFLLLHEANWDTNVPIANNFNLHKIKGDLLNFDFSMLPPVDLLYYDAFAPGKQEEMWTDDLIKNVGDAATKGGIVSTYCAKGTVRRAFEAAGFKMERVPGPKGKKEILRGLKR